MMDKQKETKRNKKKQKKKGQVHRIISFESSLFITSIA